MIYNEKNLEFKNKIEKIIFDFIGIPSETLKLIDKNIRYNIVDAFYILSITEHIEADQTFSVYLRKSFEKNIIEANIKDTHFRLEMSEKIKKYFDLCMAEGQTSSFDDHKQFFQFWKNVSEGTHEFDKKTYFDNYWKPFLKVLNFNFNLMLSTDVYRRNPFKDILEEIRQMSKENETPYVEENNALSPKKSKIQITEDCYWGIDLGTYNSSISYYIKGGVSLKDNGSISFKNKNSKIVKHSIPSAVFVNTLTGECNVAGDTNLAMYNDVIGKEWTIVTGWKVPNMDGEKEEDDTANKPLQIFKDNPKLKHVTPIFLSSLILEKLIRIAEERTGIIISNLVITVPANFGEAGRVNTKMALKLVNGWENFNTRESKHEVSILEEPMAAMFSTLARLGDPMQAFGVVDDHSLVFGKKLKDVKNEIFVIFDMGAGTTDIAVLTSQKTGVGASRQINEVAKDGFNFAGRAIDDLIYNKYVLPNFTAQNKITMVELAKTEQYSRSDNFSKFDNVLRKIAEHIKIQLSFIGSELRRSRHIEKSVTISEVVGINGEFQFSMTIDYNEANEFIKSQIKSYISTLKKTLELANIPTNKIDHFVLAGGSSQAPWVLEIVEEIFENISDKISLVNPEFAISLGASVYNFVTRVHAARITYNKVTQSITSKSYGIGVTNNGISWVIEKGEKIPTPHKTIDFFFNIDKNGDEKYLIFESEKKFPFQNMCKLVAFLDIKQVLGVRDLSTSFQYNDGAFEISVSYNNAEKKYLVDPSNQEFIDVQQKFSKFKDDFHKVAREKYLNFSESDINNNLSKYFAKLSESWSKESQKIIDFYNYMKKNRIVLTTDEKLYLLLNIERHLNI